MARGGPRPGAGRPRGSKSNADPHPTAADSAPDGMQAADGSSAVGDGAASLDGDMGAGGAEQGESLLSLSVAILRKDARAMLHGDDKQTCFTRDQWIRALGTVMPFLEPRLGEAVVGKRAKQQQEAEDAGQGSLWDDDLAFGSGAVN